MFFVIINTYIDNKVLDMKITGRYLGTTLMVVFLSVMFAWPVYAEKSDQRLIRENAKTYTGATRIIDGKIVKYPRHYSLHSHQRHGKTMIHMDSNALPYYTGYARHNCHTEVKYLNDDLDKVLDTTIKILIIKKLLD